MLDSSKSNGAPNREKQPGRATAWEDLRSRASKFDEKAVHTMQGPSREFIGDGDYIEPQTLKDRLLIVESSEEWLCQNNQGWRDSALAQDVTIVSDCEMVIVSAREHLQHVVAFGQRKRQADGANPKEHQALGEAPKATLLSNHQDVLNLLDQKARLLDDRSTFVDSLLANKHSSSSVVLGEKSGKRKRKKKKAEAALVVLDEPLLALYSRTCEELAFHFQFLSICIEFEASGLAGSNAEALMCFVREKQVDSWSFGDLVFNASLESGFENTPKLALRFVYQLSRVLAYRAGGDMLAMFWINEDGDKDEPEIRSCFDVEFGISPFMSPYFHESGLASVFDDFHKSMPYIVTSYFAADFGCPGVEGEEDIDMPHTRPRLGMVPKEEGEKCGAVFAPILTGEVIMVPPPMAGAENPRVASLTSINTGTLLVVLMHNDTGHSLVMKLGRGHKDISSILEGALALIQTKVVLEDAAYAKRYAELQYLDRLERVCRRFLFTLATDDGASMGSGPGRGLVLSTSAQSHSGATLKTCFIGVMSWIKNTRELIKQQQRMQCSVHLFGLSTVSQSEPLSEQLAALRHKAPNSEDDKWRLLKLTQLQVLQGLYAFVHRHSEILELGECLLGYQPPCNASGDGDKASRPVFGGGILERDASGDIINTVPSLAHQRVCVIELRRGGVVIGGFASFNAQDEKCLNRLFLGAAVEAADPFIKSLDVTGYPAAIKGEAPLFVSSVAVSTIQSWLSGNAFDAFEKQLSSQLCSECPEAEVPFLVFSILCFAKYFAHAWRDIAVCCIKRMRNEGGFQNGFRGDWADPIKHAVDSCPMLVPIAEEPPADIAAFKLDDDDDRVPEVMQHILQDAAVKYRQCCRDFATVNPQGGEEWRSARNSAEAREERAKVARSIPDQARQWLVTDLLTGVVPFSKERLQQFGEEILATQGQILQGIYPDVYSDCWQASDFQRAFEESVGAEGWTPKEQLDSLLDVIEQDWMDFQRYLVAAGASSAESNDAASQQGAPSGLLGNVQGVSSLDISGASKE